MNIQDVLTLAEPPCPVHEISLLSTADVAKIFGKSDRTIRRWIDRGHLIPVRIGGAVFFHAEDISRLASRDLTKVILHGRHLTGGGH